MKDYSTSTLIRNNFNFFHVIWLANNMYII